MNDDQLTRLIDEAKAAYNRPPDRVPREEMWARIERARRVDHRRVVPIRRRTWVGVALAIAASLLIGVLLGRSLDRGPASSSAPVAENRPTPPPSTGLELGPQPPALEMSTPRASEQRVATVTPDRATRSGTNPAPPVPEADAGYDVATRVHLAQTEALLTAFRSAGAQGGTDTQLSGWARDLLVTTRLLLSSPAGEDVRSRRLLEDLELVLVQIVNVSPDAGAVDRRAIERTLENGQVMTRLRTATPAGALMSGT